MKQNREPRNKHLCIQSVDIWQGRQEHSYFSSIHGVGKTDQPQAENWNGKPFLHHSQKLNQNELNT